MKIENSFLTPREGTISARQFTRLVLAGKIVDGRAGGLIFGKTDEEGGICAIYKLGTGYSLMGRLEGGEFLVNWQAATRNLKRLQAMNAGLTLREFLPQEETEPPELAQLIMSTAHPHDRIIYLHWSQFVVNREAAAKHIKELTEMNLTPNPYLECDLYKILNCEVGTADEVV